jgi:hypothetical protein
MKRSTSVASIVLGTFTLAAIAVQACGGGSPPSPQAPVNSVWPTSSAYPAASTSASATERVAPPTPAGCLDLSQPVAWSGEGTMLREGGVTGIKPVKAVCWVGAGESSRIAKDADRFGLELGKGLGDADAAKMEAHVRALAGRRVRLGGTLHASTRPRTDPPYPYVLELTVTTIEADGKPIWPPQPDAPPNP